MMTGRYSQGFFATFASLVFGTTGIAQLTDRTLATEAVAARIDKPGWMLVDVRNSNAFNGWQIGEEVRGGHIPGATNFALDWFGASRGSLAELATKKKLNEFRLILYGTNAEEARQMADWLHDHAKLPAESLFVYEDGFPAWSNDRRRPVAKLARHEKLVPAWWVRDLSQSGSAS